MNALQKSIFQRYLRQIMVIAIVVSVIGADQISKHIVRQKVEYNSQTQVVGKYLILTKVENTGAFLGLGNSMPRLLYKILMIGIPLLVIGYAFYYLFKEQNLSKLSVISISLIVGGGIGNIIDRILYGSVTDFLFFDFVIFHTGIVNIADIAVTVAFFLMIYTSFIQRQNIK